MTLPPMASGAWLAPLVDVDHLVDREAVVPAPAVRPKEMSCAPDHIIPTAIFLVVYVYYEKRYLFP
jgi:hypothetical protein